jgi:hypothetical protein
MKAIIQVEMDNAIFRDAPASELARILRNIAKRVEENGEGEITIRDINGNRCGYFQVSR